MCNNEKCLEPSHIWVHPPKYHQSSRICQKLMGHQFGQGHFSASLTSQYRYCVWDYYFLQLFSKEWFFFKLRLYTDAICAQVYNKLAQAKQDNNKKAGQEI